MASQKISELTSLATLADGDEFPILDASEALAADKNKRAALSALKTYLNVMTTAGDLIYGGASGVQTRLPLGTTGYVLRAGASAPEWVELAHSALSGLTSGDPHTQYALAAGTRAITGFQEFLGVNFTDATEKTIATGSITVTQSAHTVDTEGDASSDDLDTIVAVTGAGDLLFIKPENDARTVVLKHGTGNIYTADGNNISLTTENSMAILKRFGTRWLVVSAVGASSFDPASPGAIGGTTPAAGSFTTLSASGTTTLGTLLNMGSGATINASSYLNLNLSSSTKFGIGGSLNVSYQALRVTGGLDLDSNAALSGSAAHTFLFGANATTPPDQTLKGPNATSGNNQGGDVTIQGGAGSGTGTQGNVILDGYDVSFTADNRITCNRPFGYKAYVIGAQPTTSEGDFCVISDSDQDDTNPQSHTYALAQLRGGTWYYYKTDQAVTTNT